jgi:hypothetical protein
MESMTTDCEFGRIHSFSHPDEWGKEVNGGLLCISELLGERTLPFFLLVFKRKRTGRFVDFRLHIGVE